MSKKLILLVIVFIFSFSILNIKIKVLRENQSYINVEVRGEVNKEISLNLPLGSTFQDLLKNIELTPYSDISQYSLNKPLANKEVINIRKINQIKLVSLNSATIDELTSLEGIGPSLAKRIINYRETIHSFVDTEEIMNVEGIGIKKYEKIKDKITI